MVAIEPRALVLTAPGTVELRPFDPPEPAADQARVRVAGCGLCHTDISFYSGAVKTRHPLPLVLGHEIAGTVDAAGPDWAHLVGRDVLVPAVIPCGRCDLCRAGRDTACQSQVMPGNDHDGGMATHVLVSASSLVPIPAGRGGLSLAELAVIADAVTTPYQAIERASLAAGDLALVVGVGGIGGYAVQIARARGALVAAIDIDDERLALVERHGAAWQFNPGRTDGRAIRRQLMAQSGVPTHRWRIFEMSGTVAGQELAWTLLPPAGTLAVVGFTMDFAKIRLSNLMALDASAFGNWGCSPSLYPAALDLVLTGRVEVRPFVEQHPLSEGPRLFARLAGPSAVAPGGDGRSHRRAILIPE
jgi:6-hydroxycyclohex-1-ene-1-carbonyl-CoA dehydrogenase